MQKSTPSQVPSATPRTVRSACRDVLAEARKLGSVHRFSGCELRPQSWLVRVWIVVP